MRTVETPRIAPTTTMGAVHLTVADLDRSLAYYRSAIGLDVSERSDGRVSLGTGRTELLVLVEEAGARPTPTHAGLYHFALRVPDRVSLARWLCRSSASPTTSSARRST